MDTLLPAVDGRDDDVVEGVLVPVDNDAVLVVLVRLAVVDDDSYCGDCLVSIEESFTDILDKESPSLLGFRGEVCKLDGKLF